MKEDASTEDSADTSTVETVPEINEAPEEEETSEELTKGKQLCSENLATKIHQVVLKTVISQLHRILVQKV